MIHSFLNYTKKFSLKTHESGIRNSHEHGVLNFSSRTSHDDVAENEYYNPSLFSFSFSDLKFIIRHDHSTNHTPPFLSLVNTMLKDTYILHQTMSCCSDKNPYVFHVSRFIKQYSLIIII